MFGGLFRPATWVCQVPDALTLQTLPGYDPFQESTAPYVVADLGFVQFTDHQTGMIVLFLGLAFLLWLAVRFVQDDLFHD